MDGLPSAVPPGAVSVRFDWAELEPGGNSDVDRGGSASSADRHRDEVEEAYRRGIEDGKTASLATVRSEFASVTMATMSALEEVRASREAWERTLEENLVLLAAAMARQIVDRALDEDPSVYVDLVKRAVASFPDDDPVRIRLHPDDYQRISEEGATGLEQPANRSPVRWVPDEAVEAGGCIVEGPTKIVDGRIEEALARIVRTLVYG